MNRTAMAWLVRFGSLGLVLALATGSAYGAQGAGSLFVAGATNTPTHWNIQIGVPTNAEIRGVDPSEVGSPLPATITVIVKSSDFGNTNLVGTRIGATNDYSFSYTPPSNACNTTIVAYVSNGNNCNNDLLDDGLQNGSQNAACGFRFVTAAGQPIDCSLAVEPELWERVKQLYR